MHLARARKPPRAAASDRVATRLEESGLASPTGWGMPMHDISRVPIAAPAGVVQRVLRIGAGDRAGNYGTTGGVATRNLIRDTEAAVGDELKPGWKTYVGNLADKSQPLTTFATTEDYYQDLQSKFAKVAKSGGKTRPNFSSTAYALARVTYGLQTGMDQSGLKPSEEDLAMPHRFPYSAIERSVGFYLDGTDDNAALERWTRRLYDATVERAALNTPHISDPHELNWYKQAVTAQLNELHAAVLALEASKGNGDALDLYSPVVQRLLKAANNMHGNIPDYGPHTKINIPVSDRIHVHVERPEDWDEDDDAMQVPMTPGSHYAMAMSPPRVPRGVAVDDDDEYLVGTDGRGIDPDRVEDFDLLLNGHKRGKTTIPSSALDDF
ncbi:hypothetical protein FHR20_003407 [Sphingomonas leidyi]|uniref:Uncharacterized protein n=1 Tax=Sphingomonas leidyi TaxID=68569 RepID=A0A7X5ZX38_9SPHN|nr:hypothetical protein [Sphingomonas leidyi]NIJ66434.1 hypothetical protein [Sphingomonas leidyi]